MKPVGYANVEADPTSIMPLYDNLLVRRLEEEEYKGLLVLPGMTQTKDGRWVRQQDIGPRRGVVVARGRGDRRSFRCIVCRKTFIPDEETLHVGLDQWPCPRCKEPSAFAPNGPDRHGMDVRVGDTIIYPRFESSHMLIGGAQYTFVHEADVMAIVEPEETRPGDTITMGVTYLPNQCPECGAFGECDCYEDEDEDEGI